MLNKIKKKITGYLHQIKEKVRASELKHVYFFSGLIIIALIVFAINGFNPAKSVGLSDPSFSDKKEFQEAKMDLTYDGYEPNVIFIKKGTPVRWTINVKQVTGCTSEIMIESLGISKNLEVGKNVIEFLIPEGEKEIKFSCGMRMVWGKFVVTDDGLAPSGVNLTDVANDLPKGGGCGCGKH